MSQKTNNVGVRFSKRIAARRLALSSSTTLNNTPNRPSRAVTRPRKSETSLRRSRRVQGLQPLSFETNTALNHGNPAGQLRRSRRLSGLPPVEVTKPKSRSVKARVPRPEPCPLPPVVVPVPKRVRFAQNVVTSTIEVPNSEEDSAARISATYREDVKAAREGQEFWSLEGLEQCRLYHMKMMTLVFEELLPAVKVHDGAEEVDGDIFFDAMEEEPEHFMDAVDTHPTIDGRYFKCHDDDGLLVSALDHDAGFFFTRYYRENFKFELVRSWARSYNYNCNFYRSD